MQRRHILFFKNLLVIFTVFEQLYEGTCTYLKSETRAVFYSGGTILNIDTLFSMKCTEVVQKSSWSFVNFSVLYDDWGLFWGYAWRTRSARTYWKTLKGKAVSPLISDRLNEWLLKGRKLKSFFRVCFETNLPCSYTWHESTSRRCFQFG